MGIVDVARDALKEIPLSEVLRERVSLALDRLAEAERQIAVLQTEKGGLQAQLERERIDHKQTKKELEELEEKLHEEVLFIHGVELRRGIRTGGKVVAVLCEMSFADVLFRWRYGGAILQ